MFISFVVVGCNLIASSGGVPGFASRGKSQNQITDTQNSKTCQEDSGTQLKFYRLKQLFVRQNHKCLYSHLLYICVLHFVI